MLVCTFAPTWWEKSRPAAPVAAVLSDTRSIYFVNIGTDIRSKYQIGASLVSSHWIEIALSSDHALINFDPAVYNDITYIDNTVHAFSP